MVIVDTFLDDTIKEEGDKDIYWVEEKVVTKQATVHRTASHNKDLFVPTPQQHTDRKILV